MFTLAAASCGFTPMPSGVVPRIATTRAPIVSMSMESRRAALLGLAAAASTVAVPAFADSIEEIAARNAAAAAKEREAKAAQADVEADGPSPALLVGGLVVGGTLASTAFYSQNLSRLGTKIASGGKDDGYERGQGKKRR